MNRAAFCNACGLEIAAGRRGPVPRWCPRHRVRSGGIRACARCSRSFRPWSDETLYCSTSCALAATATVRWPKILAFHATRRLTPDERRRKDAARKRRRRAQRVNARNLRRELGRGALP
jgi:hypothetical protein